MGRPPKKDERTRRIYDAFERCVLRDGFAATTLDAVAQEAGIQRATVRHFVGNKDALVKGAVSNLFQRYHDIYETIYSQEWADLDEVVAFIFSGKYVRSTAREDALLNALMSAASADADLRRELKEFYLEYQQRLADVLRQEIEALPPDEAMDAAYVLVALAEESARFQSFGLPKRRQVAAQKAAERLVAALRETYS